MDVAPAAPVTGGSTWQSILFYVFIALGVASLVSVMLYFTVFKGNTVPKSARDGFRNMYGTEGFQGPANGPSSITCGQESMEAVALAEMFASRKSRTEEGEADLREFRMIVGKLCCMKHDLVSTSQVVDATLYLPFQTSHDRQNPADVTARCFTKSMPQRDLEIHFETWKTRATFLLTRICTSYSLTQSQTEEAKKLFDSLWLDVFSIAKGACMPNDKIPETTPSPRDPKGFVPESLDDLAPYNGYY